MAIVTLRIGDRIDDLRRDIARIPPFTDAQARRASRRLLRDLQQASLRASSPTRGRR